MAVPVHEDLAATYTDEGTDEAKSRYGKLADAFRKRFGEGPEVFARAPGRVNLIGEHIDYEGYGVLPMAIKQDTVVAIRQGGDRLVITSLHPDKYPESSFGTDPSQDVDTDNHSWGNYFMCAYKGVFEFLASKGIQQQPVGLQIMVHGTVPTGAGVSSSAAFVCSSALALLGAFEAEASPSEVAEFACTCERYVGTQSGGMDQAISIMGATGVAKLIDFHPVRAEDVYLPEEAVFVIANSLAESQKAVTADKCYNLRVVECRLAAVMLAISLGQEQAQALQLQTLKDLEPIISPADDSGGSGGSGRVGAIGEQCQAAVRQHLHDGTYQQQEIEGLLGTSLQDFFSDSPSSIRALKASGGAFKLRDRALHVYSEAARVPQFRDACNSEDGGGGAGGDKLRRLGALMDASHASCRDQYECSCPELEDLVTVAKDAGALGSRLTGAGWGGCTVSLVHAGQEAAFNDKVRASYYQPLVDAGKLSADSAWSDIIFASKPASGGAILRLEL
jgi:N-acetylgalactosamine kinase